MGLILPYQKFCPMKGERMATYTTNIGLEKPLSTERYNIAVVNKNNDIIDSELHKLDLKNQSQDELLATKKSLNTHITDTSNPHQITKAQIALGNVDNTSDMDKPISTAQQEAIHDALYEANNFTRESVSNCIHKDEILSTSEAVKENTIEGKLVDSLVIKEVFQSVSNGKKLLASAITDKGVTTDATDAFEIMVNNIREIQSVAGDDSNSPISSPYLFTIDWHPIFSSSGAFFLSVPFPITRVKKAVIKKLFLAFRKLSASNTASWYFRILGIKKGSTDEVIINTYSRSIFIATSNTNYTINTNIDQDTELDLSEYEQITGFQLGKNNTSGTVIEFQVHLQFELELYF